MMATVSGTNVQMKMVSRTHKCLRGNGLIYHLTGVEKIADGKSLTANSHPFYLLIVLQKINFLERKKRRLIVMIMTRSLVEIISFVVHFINDTL
jgi:hypothetical protein